MPDKSANESGRFIAVANKDTIILVDTWWGSAWRLSGFKWKYITFTDTVPARVAPEDVPENFTGPMINDNDSPGIDPTVSSIWDDE